MMVNFLHIPNSDYSCFLRNCCLKLKNARWTEFKKKKIRVGIGHVVEMPVSPLLNTPHHVYSPPIENHYGGRNVYLLQERVHSTTVYRIKDDRHTWTDVLPLIQKKPCTAYRTGTLSATSKGNVGLFDFVFWLLIIRVIIRRVHSYRMSPGADRKLL